MNEREGRAARFLPHVIKGWISLSPTCPGVLIHGFVSLFLELKSLHRPAVHENIPHHSRGKYNDSTKTRFRGCDPEQTRKPSRGLILYSLIDRINYCDPISSGLHGSFICGSCFSPGICLHVAINTINTQTTLQ